MFVNSAVKKNTLPPHTSTTHIQIYLVFFSLSQVLKNQTHFNIRPKKTAFETNCQQIFAMLVNYSFTCLETLNCANSPTMKFYFFTMCFLLKVMPQHLNLR